jgi:hypothetical protein
MPGNLRRHHPAISSGEEFNFGADDSNSDVSDTEHIHGLAEDAWQAVVLGPNASRRQFEEVYLPLFNMV